MELETHTEWSKSEGERQIPYDITYIWDLIDSTNEHFHRKKIMDLENRLVVSKREGYGVRWIGSLGLIEANYCFWNGLAMRSCCVTLRTMSSHLWWRMMMWEKRTYTCMCNWVTMLYSRKKSALWNNKKIKKKKRARYLNRHVTNEGIQMANKRMKRCSSSYVIKEMQIKTTMRFYYTPVRLAKIQSFDNWMLVSM